MKTITGTVVTAKMKSTVVVEVARQWIHPVYKKTVKRTKRYPVHDQDSKAHVGDRVTAVECRPLSKTKRYTLIKVENKS